MAFRVFGRCNSSETDCVRPTWRYTMNEWLKRTVGITGLDRINWMPALAVVAVGAALLAGCGKNPQAAAPPPPMPVTVVEIQPSTVPVSNEWVGTLDGFVNAQIQPQANGYLIKQDYTEGSQVAK